MQISSQQPRPVEDRPGTEPAPVAPSRRGRGPLWALAGAVLAAVVCGGAFLLAGGASDVREVRYRMSDNLCADAEMAAVGALFDRGDDSSHGEHRHRAMDVAECNDTLVEKGSQEAGNTLTLRLKLHRATDPRPEFEASGEAVETNTGPTIVKKRVEGLGERAYFGVIDLNEGAVLILTVLDGGAEFSFNLYADSTHTPEQLRPLMIKDMRALMADRAR